MTAQDSRLADFISTVQRFADAIIPHLEPIARGLVGMVISRQLREVMNQAGWLPHYTTPLNLVANSAGEADAVRNRLSEYYSQNWDDVRKAIECQMGGYNVDEDAKATLREALDAHGYGLYKSVCRLLFPEIDRLLHVEIFGRRTGSAKYNEAVSKLVSDKTLDDFIPGGWYDFDYFAHLTKAIRQSGVSELDDRIFGIFTPVKENDLQRLEQDPVPNRHAVVHGYVSYSSPQNSLNTIFIADYIFRLISQLRNDRTGV